MTTPRRPESLRAAAYALILLGVNLYICRELFFAQTAYMNSMHGFWTAIAELAGDSWFHPTWWPYWDSGIPFEFTYSPLVPALTAAWSALGHIPAALAFQSITGVAYCLGPLTLFLMAWLLTRAPGYSFAAALFYSLTAPTQLLVPDDKFHLRNFGDARRLFVVAVWDDTPHLMAVALLPLAILLLALAIQRRRFGYYAAASVVITLATLASAFGPIMVAMAAVCLLFVFPHENFKRSLSVAILIGAFALALSAAFMPPSLIQAMRAAAGNHGEPGWNAGSLTALAIVILGWTVLWRYLPRWRVDWRLQFFALFAYLTGSVPMIAVYFHRQFIPQPSRYKLEMELALALAIVFGSRSWFEKRSTPVKMALLLLGIALVGEQIASHRVYAKNVLAAADVTRTIEYRASVWADRNLPGVRIMMPGSIAQWANAFTGIPQFSGSSWSMAYNQVQQRGLDAIYNGGGTAERDARVSLAWLQAYGAGAIGVSGPNSQEFWKPFAHPAKFDDLLPVLWRENDMTIYRVPQRTASLAHVIPETALVSHAPASPSDTGEIERYVAALQDPFLPVAEFQWQGRNRIGIHGTAQPGQVISVQVSYHPGWHAQSNGRRVRLNRDGLGLIWFQLDCAGQCDVQLDYDGGAELRTCRYISFAAIVALLLVFPARRLIFGRAASSIGRGASSASHNESG